MAGGSAEWLRYFNELAEGILKLSSILKALKKLEKEAENQSHVQFWQSESTIQKEEHKQIAGYPLFKKGYVIFLAGIVFALGAGWILSQKYYKSKPELIAKKEAIRQKPDRISDKSLVVPDRKTVFKKPARLPEKKTIIPDKKDRLKKLARLPEKKVAMPQRDQKKGAPRKDIQKTKSMAKAAKAPPRPIYNAQKDAAVLYDKKRPQTKQVRKEKKAEKPKNKKTDRFASLPVKRSNQTRIEVQAIAWAEDPKSRLAVINGMILREGESIDNVIVVHIGKEAVVFKKGAEGWKQMFGF